MTHAVISGKIFSGPNKVFNPYNKMLIIIIIIAGHSMFRPVVRTFNGPNIHNNDCHKSSWQMRQLNMNLKVWHKR